MRLSHRIQITFAATALMVPMLVGGCECGSLVLPDASVPDASIDAAFAPDVQAVDASRDVLFVLEEGIGDVPVARPDVYEPVDTGFDCSTCRAALPCETLRCVTSCEYLPSADGTSCGGDDSVCVDARCVMRRCGDGWRENGSSTLPVEGCDDGNTTAGDGCDAMCAAEPFLVQMSTRFVARASTGSRPAAAVDDLGNMLVTWAESDFANYYVMARRFDRHGAPIDAAPITLGTSPSTNIALPTAQGLASGWVMAWPAWMLDMPGTDGLDIAYAMVPVTGPFGATRLVNEGDTNANQDGPSIARLESGFVIAWSSNQAPRQNIAIRYFNMDGTPRGALSHPRPVDMAVREGDALAMSRGGDAWTLGYSEGFATTTGQAIDYTGMSAGAPYTIRFADTSSAVFARGDGSTAIGLVQDGLFGRILIRTLIDGARPTDDSGFLIYGDTQLDTQLGLACLGGTEWLAIWSRPSDGSQRFAVQLSAGAARPRGLDRLEAHLRSGPIPADFSMNRISSNLRDGWLVTYTAGPTVTTMRLTPG